MRSLLLAAAAVMVATVAQAETIYVTPGSAVLHRVTKGPFKTAVSGDEGLLAVRPGATNQDLIIVANHPDGTTASANVLMIDDQGKLVENLLVIVTPFGGPSTTVRVLRPGEKNTTYLCANHTCIDASAAKSRNKGVGDADSVIETRHKDGSTNTWKRWSTPPGQI